MTGQAPLGAGPGGKGYFPAAFEESKARADERRMDRSREGAVDFDPRARTIGLLFFAAVLIGLMAYAIWDALGQAAGIAAAVVLAAGALLLWRFWR